MRITVDFDNGEKIYCHRRIPDITVLLTIAFFIDYNRASFLAEMFCG